MDSKHVKGLSVISIDDGAKVGSVDRVYLDPAQKRIVGFVVGSGGLFGGTTGVLDASDVHSVGPDALTINSKAAVHEGASLDQHDQLIDLDQLSKLKVVTEGGTYVGQVDSCEFDPNTFRLTAIVASPGFFKSNQHIPIDDVVSIGSDIVVVSDRVCQADATQAQEQGAAPTATSGGTMPAS